MFTQNEFTSQYGSGLTFKQEGFLSAITRWGAQKGTEGIYMSYELAQVEDAPRIAEQLVEAGVWAEITDEYLGLIGYRTRSAHEKKSVVIIESAVEEDEVLISVAPEFVGDFDISDVAQEIIDEVSAEIIDEEYDERFSGSMEADEDRTAEEEHAPVSLASEKMSTLISASRGIKVEAPAPVVDDVDGFSDADLERGFKKFAKAYPHPVDLDSDKLYYVFADAAERLNSIQDVLDLAYPLTENAPARAAVWLRNLVAI